MQEKKNHTSLKSGFTLIEILVAMVILSIITTFVFASFRNSQVKSRDSKRKNDLRQIALSLEAYYVDKGAYPANSIDGEIQGCGVGDAEICGWSSVFSDSNGTIYMQELPTDPKPGQVYIYQQINSGRQYQLYARIENTEDASVQQSGGNPQVYSGIDCGLDDCNYGVSSTNTSPSTGRTLVND